MERRLGELAQQPCKNCMSKDRGDVPGANVMSDERTTLSDIREMVKKFVNDREWARYHNPKDLAIAIAVEASELLEHFKGVTDKESGETMGDAEKIVKLEEELADIVIYCLIFADALRIDIAKAVEDKIRLNAVRHPASLEEGDYTNLSNI
jgi:NTP pyrophosphatase (non-canonical NTP hydrolase)